MKKLNLLLIALFSVSILGCKNNQNNSSTDSSTSSIEENSSSEKDSSSSIVEESSSSEQVKELRAINITSYEHGSIKANKTKAYEGEEIVLTITCDEGYELLSGNLKYNDTIINDNKFIMIDEDVTIFATFTKIPYTYQDTNMIVKSKVNEKEAIAYYEAKYILAGIEFKMTVFDDEVIEDGYDLTKRDSVGILVNKTNETKGLASGETVNFIGTSNGYYEISRAKSRTSFSENGDFEMNIAPGNNFYTSSYKTTLDDKKAYVVTVYLGYDLLNTTYEEGYKNLTMCPYLTNANSDGIDNQYGQNGYGYHCFYKNAKTFALINDDNAFTQRATGTDEDILDEDSLPDNYILGANFTGPGWWNMTYVCLNEAISLENAESIIVQVRFNEAVAGDWFRLGAATDDGTFYDAFGKNSDVGYKYSVSENIKETADYNWETGQWGGWDPSWNSKIAPTYYVEVPLYNMFARFSNEDGTSLNDAKNNNKKLSKLGVYLTANANYNLSVGNTYVRRNGKVEQISNAMNYSSTKEDGKNYCYAVKLDSATEQPTTLELKVYSKKNDA